MKKYEVFLVIFSTIWIVTAGYSNTSPKFALGDKVVLKDPGFYRNCEFPAFVERLWDDGEYNITFKCPSHWSEKDTQLMNMNVKESEIILYKGAPNGNTKTN